jgi:hypothetical protein
MAVLLHARTFGLIQAARENTSKQAWKAIWEHGSLMRPIGSRREAIHPRTAAVKTGEYEPACIRSRWDFGCKSWNLERNYRAGKRMKPSAASP